MFNSSKLQTRNIVITLKINHPVESNRIFLNSFFPTKEMVILRFRTVTKEVFIVGYVQNAPIDFFGKNEIAQISILCPSPFFKDATSKDYSIGTTATQIYSFSEIETGFLIHADFSGSVSDFTIENTVTNDFFTISGTIQSGDALDISTINGNKYARLTRSGAVSNWYGKIQFGSKFLKLQPGDNYFKYAADGGDHNSRATASASIRTIYRGL